MKLLEILLRDDLLKERFEKYVTQLFKERSVETFKFWYEGFVHRILLNSEGEIHVQQYYATVREEEKWCDVQYVKACAIMIYLLSTIDELGEV